MSARWLSKHRRLLATTIVIVLLLAVALATFGGGSSAAPRSRQPAPAITALAVEHHESDRARGPAAERRRDPAFGSVRDGTVRRRHQISRPRPQNQLMIAVAPAINAAPSVAQPIMPLPRAAIP